MLLLQLYQALESNSWSLLLWFLEGWTRSPCWMLGKLEDAADAVGFGRQVISESESPACVRGMLLALALWGRSVQASWNYSPNPAALAYLSRGLLIVNEIHLSAISWGLKDEGWVTGQITVLSLSTLEFQAEQMGRGGTIVLGRTHSSLAVTWKKIKFLIASPSSGLLKKIDLNL